MHQAITLAAGTFIGVAATRTSIQEPLWSLLFIGAAVLLAMAWGAFNDVRGH